MHVWKFFKKFDLFKNYQNFDGHPNPFGKWKFWTYNVSKSFKTSKYLLRKSKKDQITISHSTKIWIKIFLAVRSQATWPWLWEIIVCIFFHVEKQNYCPKGFEKSILENIFFGHYFVPLFFYWDFLVGCLFEKCSYVRSSVRTFERSDVRSSVGHRSSFVVRRSYVRPSSFVRSSVRPYVRTFVRPSVRSFVAGKGCGEHCLRGGA